MDEIQSNVDKAKEAAAKGQKGYYRDSTLANYNTFMPDPYGSVEAIIDELLEERGSISVLEVGCGEGHVAEQLKEKYGDRLQYHGLDVVEPDAECVEWVESDIDGFRPRQQYDLILSVNGLIYGHDDMRNFFNFANALREGGKMVFNYDGWTNPLGTKKANMFSEFLDTTFLDVLNEQGFNSYSDNKMGRRTFLGERNNEQNLRQEEVTEKADTLLDSARTSYLTSFKGPQRWLAAGSDDPSLELQMELLNACLEREQREGIDPASVNTAKRQSFFKWATRDDATAFGFLIGDKMPIDIYLDNMWDSHPANK